MATTARYGSLPFAEQVEFFRRKLNVNTRAWTDVYEAQHDVAFMVAGANRDDLVADFREAVGKAIADGATLSDFRRDFDRIVAKHGWDYTGGRNWRSRVIYETNLRQSYNAGRWEQLQQLKSVRPYWRYRHSDAVEVPRPIHLSWDGLVLHADDPWWHTHFPANGWGCFLPGTRVSGDLQIGLKAFYSGIAVEIETQRGSRLRVTANHPILTGRGWLAANEVNEGDELLHCVGRINATLAVVIDDKQPPSRVEDAFDTLTTQGCRVAQVAPLDLHGDAQFGKPEIHVAGSDRQLRQRHQSSTLHFCEQGPFETTDAGKLHLSAPAAGAALRHSGGHDAATAQDVIDSTLAQTGDASNLSNRGIGAEVVRDNLLLDRVIGSPGGTPRSAELALDQDAVLADSLPTQFLGGAHAADHQSMPAEQSIDGLPIAPVLYRQLLDGNPGLVAADKVIAIRKFKWTGHVFDFQTSSHLIVAEGLVVHNCQCYVEGLNARDLKRMGKDGPDPAPPVVMETVVIGQRSPGGPRTVQVPEGIDPGFGYAPGRSLGGDGGGVRGLDTPPSPLILIEQTAQSALHKTMRLPAIAAAESAAQYLALPRVTAALDAGYAAWQAAAIAESPVAASYIVGALTPAITAEAAAAAVAIAIDQAQLVAAAQRTLAASQTVAELAQLPSLLRASAAVVLDAGNGRLLYVAREQLRRNRGRSVVTVRMHSGVQGGANTFESAELVNLAELRAGIADGRLRLLSGSLD